VHGLVHDLVAFDRAAAEEVADLRWAPLTSLMIVASAWWVKGLVFALAGAAHDAIRRRPPVTGLLVLLAFGLSAAASGLIKAAVDRPRPPLDDPGHLHALVALPASGSFPSGHATTAFAAAAALAVLVPRLRWPALALAALVAFSRVYLGVHFVLDVAVGALLGLAVGAAVARTPRLVA
jgi:undecaprenyl-diphosphatase